MRSPQQIWENIKNAVLGIPQNWFVFIEAIFVFTVIYFVLKTLWDNDAKKAIIVYLSLLVLTGAIALFQSHFDAGVYYIVFLLISLFFLLLFTAEIKRGLWKTSRKVAGKSAAPAAKTSAVNARAEVYINNIVKAVQNLSKTNTGALIVLSNGNLPRNITDSGVTLNANISSQLIEGIFINKAPLHDGAMVIYGDKIQAAGCFLPLTQREFPKDYGTRHRAGIGVTEIADVSTIIVSEETGIVSVVKLGKITRYIDSENLKRFLREYYVKEFSTEGKVS
ncbi:MAG: DNA integrity scanning protein DisA nucleotide-binding domain protein [Clostridia bacterium]|nr:DNA integrity scanning protein DisA nucleotide-binding domain protein [Clostridia bacterium]